jgi:hypothetical protein
MPVSDVTQLRELIQNESISDSRLEKALHAARISVELDGVPVGNEYFGILQEYNAAYRLEEAGVIQGRVTSRSVGDVSVSLGRSASDISSWKGLYRELLIKIKGGKFGIS